MQASERIAIIGNDNRHRLSHFIRAGQNCAKNHNEQRLQTATASLIEYIYSQSVNGVSIIKISSRTHMGLLDNFAIDKNKFGALITEYTRSGVKIICRTLF